MNFVFLTLFIIGDLVIYFYSIKTQTTRLKPLAILCCLGCIVAGTYPFDFPLCLVPMICWIINFYLSMNAFFEIEMEQFNDDIQREIDQVRELLDILEKTKVSDIIEKEKDTKDS